MYLWIPEGVNAERGERDAGERKRDDRCCMQIYYYGSCE